MTVGRVEVPIEFLRIGLEAAAFTDLQLAAGSSLNFGVFV